MARQSLREEIVDAAVEQFHTHGFNAAGVKDITDAAGAPKGSFYNHFGSKEALAIEVLERYGVSRRLDHLAENEVEPLRRLRAHFVFLRDETVRQGFARGCLFGNFGAEIADHSEPIRATVAESLASWAASIAATLAEAQRDGTLRADLHPETAARFLLNAWEGTLISARADRSAIAFDAFFDIAFGPLLAPPLPTEPLPTAPAPASGAG